MNEIYRSIPHRPPFLFIDEMIEVREDGAIAKRLVRADEPHFEGHYPGNPIMPGVLLCEAVFQTAAVYLVHRMKGEGGAAPENLTPILARIGDARFKNMVVPGDELQIEVTYKETMGKFHFLRGKVMKEGRVAVALEFALALIDQSEGKG